MLKIQHVLTGIISFRIQWAAALVISLCHFILCHKASTGKSISVQIKFCIVCGLHCARVLSTAHCARAALLKMLTFYGVTCLFGNILDTVCRTASLSKWPKTLHVTKVLFNNFLVFLALIFDFALRLQQTLLDGRLVVRFLAALVYMPNILRQHTNHKLHIC